MKNTIILTTSLMLAGSVAFAQTTDVPATKNEAAHTFSSKNGHEVLPQAKDWALGISATGFLNYMGNLMNGNSFNSAPAFNSANEPTAFAIGNISGMALSGKYMKTATLAYRARFQVNAGRTSYHNSVYKNLATPDPLNPQYVEDALNVDAHVVLLSAGFEKRRGNGRLQGLYGAEAIVGFAGNKRTYKYGNAFSAEFPAVATTTDFVSGSSSYVSSRTLETYSGNTMLAGVRGFTGVEYFIAPKMSIGGEIGYSLGFSTNGKGYTVNEQWVPGMEKTVTVNREVYPSSGLRSFGVGLDNVNAGINLHFYF
ncbi:hypothetical protein GCM10023093_31710 [Nemorincola caseinilytica]|uniref:Outer membrane protein beta-barrel domain-containing protein n=1 Tax=Nemorincola caseinilytica TaxID=2054315 RepID=A0ABP8NSS4_9BACT